MKKINSFIYNDFIFSRRYRVWRHLLYWAMHILLWTVFWKIMGDQSSFSRILFNMSLWVPVFILYGYPLAYIAIPRLLLNGKVWQFFLLIIGWGIIGLYINSWFRTYLYTPFQLWLGFETTPAKGQQAQSYLYMTTSAASPMILQFFKLWSIKQREWMNAQKEKITTELQLLKAQVHPHFLFNTLNSIYSFSRVRSPKTPEMILKLSSLLSYMLYDCKSEEVRLDKEIEIMKNYIDLEKERYGNKIEISWSLEGETSDKFIAPLLLLPLLENAFKHGTSGQIEKSWLSVDISAKHLALRYKIANSKDELFPYDKSGTGINNVKKRLEFLYPEKHELKINDEGNFFVVSMMVKMPGDAPIFVSNPSQSGTAQVFPV